MKIHDGRVTFICLMCYIIIPEGWKSLLVICNLLPDSWDINLLDAGTTGSGGKSLITLTIKEQNYYFKQRSVHVGSC